MNDGQVYPVVIEGADNSGPAFESLRENADKSRGAMKLLGNDTADTAKKTESAFSSIAKTAAGVVGGMGLVKLASDAIDKFREVKDQLRELGDRGDQHRISAELMAGFDIGAAQAGLSTEKLNTALDAFDAVSKKTEDDAKSFYKALGQIDEGLKASFKSALTQTERLDIMAQAFRLTSDEAKRAQLANAAFGTDSERVIGLVSRGSDDLISQAKQLGIEIDQSMVQKAQASAREMGVLSTVLKLQVTAALGDFLPAVKDSTTWLLQFAPAARDAANSVLDFFRAIDQRSTKGLQSDLEASVSTLRRLRQEQAALDQEQPYGGLTSDPGGFFTRRARREIEADKAAKEEQIRNEEWFQAELRTRLAGRAAFDDAAETVHPRWLDAAFDSLAAPTAFKPRKDLDKDDGKSARDAFDRQVTSVSRHIAVMEADAKSVDKTAGEHEKLRTQAQLLEAAQTAGIEVTGETAKTFERLADRAQKAADALAAAKLQSQLLFDRQQLGRTELEQRVSQQLRGAGIDPQSAQGQYIAQQIRLNATLSETKDLSKDALKGIIEDMKAGKTGAEAFANALNKVESKLEDKALDVGLSAIFGAAGKNSSILSLFGLGGSSGGVLSGGAALGQGGIGHMAEGGVIPPGGLAIVSEHAPGGGRLVRAGDEPVMVTPDDIAPRAGGGDLHFTYAPSISGGGNADDIRAELMASEARVRASVVPMVRDAIRRKQL